MIHSTEKVKFESNFGGDMLFKIIINENLQKISQKTVFTYRELYVLALLFGSEILQLVLHYILTYELSVEKFLLEDIGIIKSQVNELLFGDVEYIYK